jgi:type I restriction enzyme M protein
VFKPYAGVSTAIVLFTKTNSGGTDDVWFYDCQADGFSLNDMRTPLLPVEKIGPKAKLADDEHVKNNLPDIAARWPQRHGTERKRHRTSRSFCVPKAEIAAAGYDLSINRYKKVVHESAEHRSPQEIIAELKTLEQEIVDGLDELEADL